MFKLLKYADETKAVLYLNRMIVLYGSFVLESQSENIIVLRSNQLKYTVIGTDLCLNAISKPKTVISGKIERVELI